MQNVLRRSQELECLQEIKMIGEERLVYTDFENPVVIETSMPGLVLRQYTPDDAEEIYRVMHASREHLRTSGEDIAGNYPTVDDVLDSIVRPLNPFKLRTGIRLDDVLIGGANLQPFHDCAMAEIGYWLSHEFTGRGYMTRAVEALVGYAFDTGVHEVVAFVLPENQSSAGVLLRTGFRELASLPDSFKNTFARTDLS